MKKYILYLERFKKNLFLNNHLLVFAQYVLLPVIISLINFSVVFIVLYCIVLKGWSLLPKALRPFQINCAPPNLGIGTWTCRLNFAQRPIFQAWYSLTGLKSQTRDPQLKVPPGGLLLRIFTSWKSPSTSAGFESANLGSRDEHGTPRPPRPIGPS